MTGSTRYVGYVNGNDEGNPNGAVSDDDVAGVRGDDNTLLYIGATINTPIEGVAVGVAYDDRVWETCIVHQESDSVGVYAAYSLSDDVSISARYDIGTIEGSGIGGYFRQPHSYLGLLDLGKCPEPP